MATKTTSDTTENQTVSTPKTGDAIMTYVSICILATIGFILTQKYTKLYFKGKH